MSARAVAFTVCEGATARHYGLSRTGQLSTPPVLLLMLLYGARVEALLPPTRLAPLLTPALLLLPTMVRPISRYLRAARVPGLPAAPLLLATPTPASLLMPLLRCGRVTPAMTVGLSLPSRGVVALLPRAAPAVPLLRGVLSWVRCALCASCLAVPPRVGIPLRAAMRGVAAAG